jgi:hypothetical protein
MYNRRLDDSKLAVLLEKGARAYSENISEVLPKSMPREQRNLAKWSI